jgi:hypothetical protein
LMIASNLENKLNQVKDDCKFWLRYCMMNLEKLWMKKYLLNQVYMLKFLN